MGFPLFERSTRQLRLTAAGKIVCNSLGGMVNELFYIVPCKNVTEVDNYETLCLLLDQGEAFTVLPPAVDRYCEQHGKGLPLPCGNFDFSLSLVYSKSNPHPFLPELCAFIQETLES